MSFKFFNEYMILRVDKNMGDTVRINGKPAKSSNKILNASSIGFKGKLYYLNLENKQLEFPLINFDVGARENV